jgi:hypothetical protein
MDSLERLFQQFPRTPKLKIIKVDVLREGIKYSPIIKEIGTWAIPENNYIFEYDHYYHLKEKAASPDAGSIATSVVPETTVGWIMTPTGFRLMDGTHVQIGFNSQSPYEVRLEDNGKFFLYHQQQPLVEIYFDHRPEWFTQKTTDGVPMSTLIELLIKEVLVGYVTRHCEYFNTNNSCSFCCLTQETRAIRQAGVVHQVGLKPKHGVEVYEAAVSEHEVRMFIFTGGSLINERKEADLYIRLIAALKEVKERLKKDTTFLAAPAALEEEDSRRMFDAGADYICFNLEVWDPRLFQIICPGKASYIGRDRWLERLKAAVKVFGEWRVSSNFVLGAELTPPYGYKTMDEGLASMQEGFRWCLDNGIVPMTTILTPGRVTGYRGEVVVPPTEYLLQVGAVRRQLIKKYLPEEELGLWVDQ